MHIVDLGIAHHVVGNVLFLLCYTDRFFPLIATSQGRCDAVWNKIERQYQGRQTPVQLSNLELSWFTDTQRRRFTNVVEPNVQGQRNND